MEYWLKFNLILFVLIFPASVAVSAIHGNYHHAPESIKVVIRRSWVALISSCSLQASLFIIMY